MEDVKTVHYATKDPIKNLRVRVTLTKVSIQRAAAPPAAHAHSQQSTQQQGQGQHAAVLLPAAQQPFHNGVQPGPATVPSGGAHLPSPSQLSGDTAVSGAPDGQSVKQFRPLPPDETKRDAHSSVALQQAQPDNQVVPLQMAAAGVQQQRQQQQPVQQQAVSDPFASAQGQTGPARQTSARRQPGPLGEAVEQPYTAPPQGRQAQTQYAPMMQQQQQQQQGGQAPAVLLPPTTHQGLIAPHAGMAQPTTWVQPLSPQGTPSPGGPDMQGPVMPAAGQWPLGPVPAPFPYQPQAALGPAAAAYGHYQPIGHDGRAGHAAQRIAPMYGVPSAMPLQWGAHVDPTTGLPIPPPIIVPLPAHQQLHAAYPAPHLQAPQAEQAPSLSQKLEVSRVFSWQEKVHSTSEVAAARLQAAQLHDMGLSDTSDQAAGGQAPSGMRGRSRRVMALGSLTADGLKAKAHVNPKAQGSMLFTYIHSDEFAEQQELLKRITTTEAEQSAPLYQRLIASAKLRQEVLNFRTMYIMADLAAEGAPAHSHNVLLVAIKSYPDGSFDMRPGFNKPGKKYRFEDAHGGIYEYSVEDASTKAEPSLARRTAVLQRQVAARAAELRGLSVRTGCFQPAPEDGLSMRLVVLGEVMGCADFHKDRLYIEYMLKYDPSLWEMASTSWAAAELGVYKGVTAVCSARRYPADHASCTPERWVGHWSHPLECELLSRGPPPAPSKYPVLLFQVCSLDRRNRFSCQGYTWCSLADGCPGSHVANLQCWRPLHSARDKQQEFFIGGSAELQDMSYIERGPLQAAMAVQRSKMAASGMDMLPGQVQAAQSGPKAMNKYGFRTETTGCIKVRLHCITQQLPQEPDDDLGQGLLDTGRAGDQDAARQLRAASIMSYPLTTYSKALSPGKRTKREVTLAAVVERARGRLREARGGDVHVRPGLVSQAPSITQQPMDVHVVEGQIAQFKLVATGMAPLQYQWFKDGRQLSIATSDSCLLILAEVTPLEAGAYTCQVSNKDGTVVSMKAVLKVDKLSRATRAMGHGNDETRSILSHRSHTSNNGGVSARGGYQDGPSSALPTRAGAAARMSRLQRQSLAATNAQQQLPVASTMQQQPTSVATNAINSPRNYSPALDAPPQLHMDPALQQRLSQSAATSSQLPWPSLQQQQQLPAHQSSNTAQAVQQVQAGIQPSPQAVPAPPTAALQRPQQLSQLSSQDVGQADQRRSAGQLVQVPRPPTVSSDKTVMDDIEEVVDLQAPTGSRQTSVEGGLSLPLRSEQGWGSASGARSSGGGEKADKVTRMSAW